MVLLYSQAVPRSCANLFKHYYGVVLDGCSTSQLQKAKIYSHNSLIHHTESSSTVVRQVESVAWKWQPRWWNDPHHPATTPSLVPVGGEMSYVFYINETVLGIQTTLEAQKDDWPL